MSVVDKVNMSQNENFYVEPPAGTIIRENQNKGGGVGWYLCFKSTDYSFFIISQLQYDS